jgi:hypothetical protein
MACSSSASKASTHSPRHRWSTQDHDAFVDESIHELGVVVPPSCSLLPFRIPTWAAQTGDV